MTVGDIDSCSLACLRNSGGQSATFPPDEALQIVNRLAYERRADLAGLQQFIVTAAAVAYEIIYQEQQRSSNIEAVPAGVVFDTIYYR